MTRNNSSILRNVTSATINRMISTNVPTNLRSGFFFTKYYANNKFCLFIVFTSPNLLKNHIWFSIFMIFIRSFIQAHRTTKIFRVSISSLFIYFHGLFIYISDVSICNSDLCIVNVGTYSVKHVNIHVPVGQQLPKAICTHDI